MTNGIDHHGKHGRGQASATKKRKAKKGAAKPTSAKTRPSWIAKAVHGNGTESRST